MEVLDAEEAAKYLKVTNAAYVRRLVMQKKLKGVKIGKKSFFTIQDLKNYQDKFSR